MSLSTEKKQQTLTKFQLHQSDTASPQVQIALLTARLDQLKDHFTANKKDHHSRIGLMRLVGQRKRLLSYLNKRDHDAYKKIIGELGLRK